MIRQSLAALRATDQVYYSLYFLGIAAELCRMEGHAEEGLATVSQAVAMMASAGVRTYEAELHRVRGELLLVAAHDRHDEAEDCFRQALELARQQGAKSLELRAATSWARLLQQQGRPDAARPMLAEIYGWFTEGFDTVDLKEAKALLNELT